MCKHVKYDRAGYEAGDPNAWDCDPEHILTTDNFATVCSGYARTYNYILQKLGVPVRNISYIAGEHEWNQVYIDGTWYNVDVTWMDDWGNRSVGGQTVNRFEWSMFLCSYNQLAKADVAQGLQAHAYYNNAYLSQFKTDDTTYDNHAW